MTVELPCPEHASRIFERLTGARRVFDGPVPLAEVYAAARTAELGKNALASLATKRNMIGMNTEASNAFQAEQRPLET
jgi:hypothetical protein